MLVCIVLANSIAVGILHHILTDAGEILGPLKLRVYEADLPFISKALCCSKCFAGWVSLVLCEVYGLEFEMVLPVLAETMFATKMVGKV